MLKEFSVCHKQGKKKKTYQMMELDCHGAMIPPSTSRLDENKKSAHAQKQSHCRILFVAFYLLMNVEEKK